jgi:hypothetical protein
VFCTAPSDRGDAKSGLRVGATRRDRPVGGEFPVSKVVEISRTARHDLRIRMNSTILVASEVNGLGRRENTRAVRERPMAWVMPIATA